jgi:hypothetical protein
MPTSLAERTAARVDPPVAMYRCSHCGQAHQLIDLMAGGLNDAYARQLVSDPYSPAPTRSAAA